MNENDLLIAPLRHPTKDCPDHYRDSLVPKCVFQSSSGQVAEVFCNINTSRKVLNETELLSWRKKGEIIPELMIVLKSVLRDAIQCEKDGDTDSALDLLYNAIDDLMWAENLDEIDSVLTRENAEQLSVDLGLALLCTTLPVRERLGKRDSFYQYYEQRLENRQENEQGLLDGLK